MTQDASPDRHTPGPRRVVFVDVEDPLPDLGPDDRYADAMVIARKGGVPVGAVDIDLTRDPRSVRASVEELVGQVERDASTPPTVADSDLPTISVVVPTIVARGEDLELLLDGFSRVEYPDVDYILVDNRPTVPADDPLPALLEGRSDVRVVPERTPGISAARNAGVAAAIGEIVVFTDDDVRVDPSWLLAIGRRFASDPAIDAVTGLILPAELETTAQIWFEHYYGGFSGTRSFQPLILTAQRSRSRLLRGSRIGVRDTAGTLVREFPVYGIGGYGAGANMAFRTSAIRRLGGFDVALGTGTPARGGEDLAFLVSVLWNGGTLVYEPAAVVHHKHRREVSELVRQLRGNGVGFTAMLTALVRADRRHLVGLVAQLPPAVGNKLGQSLDRLRGRKIADTDTDTDTDHIEPPSASYPRSLVGHELRGYTAGPWAYVRSRRKSRSPSGTSRTGR